MIAATLALALWVAASVLIGWLTGRFIRVGMVELQLEARRDATECRDMPQHQ